MFSTRLISMCILMPIVIAMLLLLTVAQLSIFIFIVCLLGAWEWGKIMSFSVYMHKFWMCTIFLLLCMTMEMIVFQNYLYFHFWKFFKYICGIIVLWWMLALFMMLSYPNSSYFWHNSNVLRFCFGMLIILPFFWGVLTLRQFYYVTINNVIGMWWLLYISMLIWINDSSAYIFGKTLGQHKLLEKISPQKTWEGLFGGLLISIGIAWLFSTYTIIAAGKPFIVFICSVITIFSAILGDFTESMFKREAKIKDTGNLIPGHGGILDRIDSLTAAIPIFTCLMFLTHTDNIIIKNFLI